MTSVPWLAALLCAGTSALASPAQYLIQAAEPPLIQESPWPRRIPAEGGEVILPSPGSVRAYEGLKYASARRVGNTLYISGVVAGGGRDGGPADAAAFRESLRRAFGQIQANLTAAGSGFEDVVMLNTFHVWRSPSFVGDKREHFETFAEVKDEFMPPPYPAWTAVGVTELLGDGGLVEIQVIAHIPAQPD